MFDVVSDVADGAEVYVIMESVTQPERQPGVLCIVVLFQNVLSFVFLLHMCWTCSQEHN